jgi:hypothetical protein
MKDAFDKTMNEGVTKRNNSDQDRTNTDNISNIHNSTLTRTIQHSQDNQIDQQNTGNGGQRLKTRSQVSPHRLSDLDKTFDLIRECRNLRD